MKYIISQLLLVVVLSEFSYAQNTEGVAYYLEIEDTSYLDFVDTVNKSDSNLNPILTKEREEWQKEFRKAEIELATIKTR